MHIETEVKDVIKCQLHQKFPEFWLIPNPDEILTLDKTVDSRKQAKLQYSDMKYADTKNYGGEINPRMLPSNCPKLLRKLSL